MRLTGFLCGGQFVDGFFANTAFACLRVFSGSALAILHGRAKLPVTGHLVAKYGEMGLPNPEIFAWAAAVIEVGGGLLVALGLLTRPAAFLVVLSLGLAAFVGQSGEAIIHRELALLYLGVFLVFTFSGAGRFSIDRLIAESRRKGGDVRRLE